MIAAALLAVPVAVAAIAHLESRTPAGATTSTAATATAAREQARALAGLIEDSSHSRTSVKDAVVATKACRSLPTNAQTFREAARSRRSQHDRAAALEVSALPSGGRVRDSLEDALNYSIQADNAFAAWATELTNEGCRAGDTVTANFTKGDRYSNSATAEKKRFVGLWNPIATAYRLPRFVYSDV
jgi:hypothetical protein